MIRSKKIFTGGANQDDSLHLLEDSQYLRIMNGRVGVTQYGRNARVENVPGTTIISQAVYPPYGTNICIGSCIDTEGQRMLWFICNTFGDHGIYCFDFVDNQVYAVIYDSQVQEGLNFNKNYRIDKNCRVINGILYWSDNYNEPKKINIDKGIKTNHASYQTEETAYDLYPNGIPYTTLTVIRRPPFYSLQVAKSNDATYNNNFIERSAFQMCYYYEFVDDEKSRLSAFSDLLNFNSPDSNANYIAAELPYSEYIEDEIQRINICAKDVLNNVIFIVKTFDKANATDLAAINAHNAGTAQLAFDFYNNIAGANLDSSQSNIPFDSVPILTKTLETATSRLFMGNNLSGYDTPTETSLTIPSATNTSPASNTFTSEVTSYYIPIKRTTFPFDTTVEEVNFMYTSSYFNKVLYYNTYRNSPPAIIPSPLNLADVTIEDYNLTFFLNNFTSTYTPNTTGYDWDYANLSSAYTLPRGYFITINNNTGQFISQNLYKTGASYNISIAFYDRFRRKCGVVSKFTNYNIPDFVYGQSSFVSYLNWAVSNANAVNEIPDWAYYYQILSTKNLNSTSFLQVKTAGAQYASRATSTTDLTYGGTYSSGIYAVGLNISPLNSIGIGYNYQDGDMVKVYLSSTPTINLRIIGQDGDYILVDGYDFGALSATTSNFFIEIYTPKKTFVNEPFFEVSDCYAVTNPGTVSRQYGTLTGQLSGDVYTLERTDVSSALYYTQNMSPNDSMWQYWNTNTGWPNFITTLGQTRNEHEIRYSNVYTAGTANNGLSTFEALNFKNVPLGTGSIQKLQLASKTTEQGVIMLSIGAFQTSSCYLGEVQLVGSSSNSALVQDTSVIGTINVLKGMYGTTAPETVVEYLGNIFFYDLNNGQVVQYSSNGLFPISSFKMERLFKNYAKGYLAANNNNLDNINGFHHLPTFIDPFHKEFGISLVGLTYENYASTLPSYATVPSYASSIINRFDISDNLAKTVVFNLVENKWISDYQFMGEQYDYFDNRFFGFKNGAPYEFNTNTSTWNTWFGTQYPVRVCWVVNKPLSGLKDMSEIVMETSVAPDFTVVYTTLPNTQITDLTSSDYVNQEGILYGRLFRDRLSPNATGTPDQKLMTGDIVISQIPQIMAEFQQYSSIIYINFVDVGFNLSRGQNFILAE